MFTNPPQNKVSYWFFVINIIDPTEGTSSIIDQNHDYSESGSLTQKQLRALFDLALKYSYCTVTQSFLMCFFGSACYFRPRLDAGESARVDTCFHRRWYFVPVSRINDDVEINL